MQMKYTDILKQNKELREQHKRDFNISIISNITVSQLKDICEFVLAEHEIYADINIGEYDNIVQDSDKLKTSDSIIVFFELCNIVDKLEFVANILSDDEIEGLISKVQNELLIIFKNLENVPLVIFNKFSSTVFNNTYLRHNKMDYISEKLNSFLAFNIPKNFKIIDIDRLFATLSVNASVDWRFYYSSKALYSIEFFKLYAKTIAPIYMSVRGKAKKAIIFDCDNTLWKGILGEDGFDGIKIYKEIHLLAIELSKNGVIVGLCSKNNMEDVEHVINMHPDSLLKNEHIVVKTINWQDKASNLKNIASILNIGLDSIVFVDDSEFEVNLINEKIPQIATILVPKNYYDYIYTIRQAFSFFYNLSATEEDSKKIEMYKQDACRASEQLLHTNIDDYLRSLGLNIVVHKNNIELAARISQLTQKTNQFNLTTKRCTEAEILKFIESGHLVLAGSVSDRFGNSGLTCVAIVEIRENIATVDTFLMSCRVLGRNIEYKFFDELVNILSERGVDTLIAKYVKTLKNQQVSDLYDRLGFSKMDERDGVKSYSISTGDYVRKDLDYIGVSNGK